MSTTISVDPTAVAAAANFLEEFLTDQVPLGDFSQGTAMRDIAVQAIAAVFAFLQADAAQVRQMQSLVSVQAATGTSDPQALTDAVTAILSNFLITPGSGAYARGSAIGHSTQQVDVFIPATARFTYSAGLIFVVDNGNQMLLIPQASLVPVIDTDGSVLDYEFTIPLVAIATGTDYNVAPGLFSAFDRFNPYVTRVETTVQFEGGAGPESATDIIARAPTAVSVRNLINSRSIPAVLDDNFDGIESVLVVGMGDPEMQRDTVPTIAPNLLFHVGGCVDIYLRTALVETSFTGAIGALFMRPDGLSNIFRDGSVSFSAVEPGDIINVTAGLPVVSAQFLVIENDGSYLVVSERSPFPVPTDEASPPTTVSYTIGRIGPNYTDVLSDVGGLPYTTGVTSRQVLTTGRITLPGGPVMDIIDVAILNPLSGDSAYKSTLDGFVHFETQVNTTPSDGVSPAQGFQFQAIVHNPLFAQSSAQWLEIVVGTDTEPSRFDGLQLRVRYNTIDLFDEIDTFVRGSFERVSAAYQLPRGHHPITVQMVITYRLMANASTLLDDTAIAQTVVDYINNFDATSGSIDVSNVIRLVLDTYPTIANIIPPLPGAPLLTIFYSLRAPTGDVVSYSTTDVVEIDATKQVAGPTTFPLNGQQVTLAAFGVSDRTMRYVANAVNIIAKQEGT